MRIVITNHDESGLTDAELEPMAAAIDKQVHTDFQHAYRDVPQLRDRIRACRVVCAHQVSIQLGDDWPLELDPYAQHATPLLGWGGFHGVRGGLPFGKVRTGAALTPPSVMLSHEALEMLARPYLDVAFNDRLFEICDPVTFDDYRIDNVRCSNFVTPFWFGPPGTPDRYDHMELLQAPLELRPGGFIGARINGVEGILRRPLSTLRSTPLDPESPLGLMNAPMLARLRGES